MTSAARASRPRFLPIHRGRDIETAQPGSTLGGRHAMGAARGVGVFVHIERSIYTIITRYNESGLEGARTGCMPTHEVGTVDMRH